MNWQNLEMDKRPKVRYWLPAAAMDEEDLREELRQLKARGFGGVELVVLTMFSELGRSVEGWGTPRWEHMVDVAADETQRLGMSMDIAIGPGWPIASPAIKTADDPAAIRELTFGEAKVVDGYEGPLPERRVRHEEGTPVLVAAMAYREIEENVLERASYTDLMPYLSEGKISWKAQQPGAWRIFAFYCQPADSRINAGQTYVVDHHGKAGAEAVEAYWDQVFSERPPYPSLESFFCDSLEYRVCMDWTVDFPEEFEKRRGYSILPYLPFLGRDQVYPPLDVTGCHLDEKEIEEQVGRDYYEALTQCYCENHLETLSRMAEKYGKTIRYQVAYNKMLEVERSGLYVALPENEALGRPTIDYMKTMAAAAHLGRKARHSFECAAEFGHSYGQNYEDLFWWVKRATMAGMNAQVLHGASYSGGYHGALSENGHMKGVEWPGYEGFGKFVSNYWNRTPSVDDARACLDAITRINTVFREQARVDCLIFRDDYLSHGTGSEFCLYNDGGTLANHGYSYEFASEAVLYHPACEVRDGLLDAEGTGYRCLLVPHYEAMSIGALQRIAELFAQGLPVFWVGGKPSGKKYLAETQEDWEQTLAACEDIPMIEDMQEVPHVLRAKGVLPRVTLQGEKDVMTAVRETEDATYYILYGYNRVVYDPEHPTEGEMSVSSIYRKGTTKRTYERPGLPSRQEISVLLEGKGRVVRMEPFSGQTEALPFAYADEDHVKGTVTIEEDEMVILALQKGIETGKILVREPVCEHPVRFLTLELASFEPDAPDETSFLRSHFEPYGEPMPIAGGLPDFPARFGGKARYTAEITLPKVDPLAKYVLELGDVDDTFRVQANGEPTPFPDQVMKRVDLSGLLHEGKNDLVIEVTTNLYNRLFTGGEMPFGEGALTVIPRKYGIHESEAKPIRLVEYGQV